MNINSRIERIAWHDALADALCAQMSSDRFVTAFVRAGGENSPLAKQLALIRSIGGPMATRIRREPDGKLIMARRIAHWDVKAAKAIEKDAWMEYEQLHRRGEPVMLFVAPRLLEDPPPNDRIFCLMLNELVLAHGVESIAEFDAANQFPVDPEGWLRPDWHSKGTPRGSGTPFRYIRLQATRKLCLGKACRQQDGTVALTCDLFAADSLERALKGIDNVTGRWNL
jgi:hypothetical protein